MSSPLEYIQTEQGYDKDLSLAFKLAPDLASIEHDAHHYVSTVVVNLYNTIILRSTTAFFLALTTLVSFFLKKKYNVWTQWPFTVSLFVFIHHIFVMLLNKDYGCTNGNDSDGDLIVTE